MNESIEYILFTPLEERHVALAIRAKAVARQCCAGCDYRNVTCPEACDVLFMKQELAIVSKDYV